MDIAEALHSTRLTEIASIRFEDAANKGAGILVGRNEWSKSIGVALIQPGGAYIVVKHWPTEEQARAHANRIWADKVKHGSLAGALNCPR